MTKLPEDKIVDQQLSRLERQMAVAALPEPADYDDPNTPRGFPQDWEAEAPFDPEVDSADVAHMLAERADAEPFLVSADDLDANGDYEPPFVVRYDAGRSIEIFDSRRAAEERFEELGAAGHEPQWVAYRQADEDDFDFIPDLPELRDDPPYYEDRAWWSRFSPAFEMTAEDEEADRMAWLDVYGSTHDWASYPGPGLWSAGRKAAR